MGIVKDDYRFCVEMSLQILQDERNKLLNDSTLIEADIINALYSYGEHEKTTQKLFLEKYTIEWLCKHWEDLNGILDKHTEFTRSEKRHFVMFFAGYFKDMFDELFDSETVSLLKVLYYGIRRKSA